MRLLLILSACLLANLGLAQGSDLSITWMEDRPTDGVLIKYEGQKTDPTYKQGAYKRYLDGQQTVRGQYFRNRKTGVWERYHSNRKLMMRGAFEDGQKTGDWAMYFPDGQQRAAMQFDRGMRTGEWKGWYADGQQACVQHFVRDHEVGTQTFWHRNGKLAEVRKRSFLNDSTEVLRVKRYYENGKIAEQGNWVNGLPDSIYTSYHRNTLEWERLVYENGKLLDIELIRTPERVTLSCGDFAYGTGEARFYHQAGWLYAKEHYSKGLRHGPARYYDRGTLRISGQWENGHPTGTWEYYTRAHTLEREQTFANDGTGYEKLYILRKGPERLEGPLENGMRHGSWSSFNFYGEEIARTEYAYGYPHGVYREFASGNIRATGEFRYGEPVGEWKYYNNWGKLTFAHTYLKNVAFDPELMEDPKTQPITLGKEFDWRYNPTEQYAVLAGGEEAEATYIAENVVMPQEAVTNEVEGVVQVQLTIDELGEVVDAQILRGIGYGCDEEALRVLTQMPWRQPHIEAGIPRKTRIITEVTFGEETSR